MTQSALRDMAELLPHVAFGTMVQKAKMGRKGLAFGTSPKARALTPFNPFYSRLRAAGSVFICGGNLQRVDVVFQKRISDQGCGN